MSDAEKDHFAEMQRKIDRLRSALKFYADPCSYMWWINRPETKDTRRVLRDGGDKAREALRDTP